MGAGPPPSFLYARAHWRTGAVMLNLRQAIAAILVAIGGAVTALAETTPHEPRLVSGVRIEAFDVEEVARIAPGVDLAFTLFGTPGAEAQVRIDGADATL